MTRTALALVAVLVAAAPLGATAATADGAPDTQSHAGTHATYEVAGDALVDYTVDGELAIDALQVQATSAADLSGTVGLAAVTDLDGADLSTTTRARANAALHATSGAVLTAHDTTRGTLVVRAGGTEQYVTAELPEGASAEARGDGRVVVTTADGMEACFLAVGDGEVTVNEEGNVSARLAPDARLVYRAYPEGRTEAAATVESLVREGAVTAAADVRTTDGDTAVDTSHFDEDVGVSLQSSTDSGVTLAAHRNTSEGTVLLVTVPDAMVGADGDLAVSVDGETAVRASSSSELAATAESGDVPAYRVVGDADGRTRLLVAVTHFSTREITVRDASPAGSDGGGAGDADGGTSSDRTSEDGAGDDATSTAAGDGGTGTATDSGASDPDAEQSSSTARGASPAAETTSDGQAGFSITAVLAVFALAALLSASRH